MSHRETATVENLEQGYVFCDSDKRFLLLHTFLKKNKNKKIIVFMSSCLSVKYHAELLNYIDITVFDLHVSVHFIYIVVDAHPPQGKQKQGKRTQTFFEFVNAKSGILVCTDVAARGLDIPQVDWIIQFDPPDDPRVSNLNYVVVDSLLNCALLDINISIENNRKWRNEQEYIHRVGRTARAGKSGRALLFLLPEEVGFLKYLRQAKVPVNEYVFPTNKIANVQEQVTILFESECHIDTW